MGKYNLQEFSRKEDAVNVCKKNGTSVKEVIIENIDEIIVALKDIQETIRQGKRAQNEDWLRAARPLKEMMNALGNGWYLENE